MTNFSFKSTLITLLVILVVDVYIMYSFNPSVDLISAFTSMKDSTLILAGVIDLCIIVIAIRIGSSKGGD